MVEQFHALSQEKQKSVSAELDRTPAEVLKKIQDFRTSVGF